MLRGPSRPGNLCERWKRLPARERLMLSLLFYEGLTPTETARALGCTVREVIRATEGRLESLRRSMGSEPAGGRVTVAARTPAAEPKRRAA